MGLLSKIFKKAATDAVFETTSPNGRLVITFVLNRGEMFYSVSKDGKPVVHNSKLGLSLRDGASLDRGMSVVRAFTKQKDETWEAYWGEQHFIRDITANFTGNVVSLRRKDHRILIRVFLNHCFIDAVDK